MITDIVERLREQYEWSMDLSRAAREYPPHDGPDLLSEAADEIERLHSWDGIMSLLDKYYPADIFTGVSGDPGPQIIVLTRELDKLRAKYRVNRRALHAVFYWAKTHGLERNAEDGDTIAQNIMEHLKDAGVPAVAGPRQKELAEYDDTFD